MTLLQAATDVRLRAYAPYSRFLVGAALRTTTGAVWKTSPIPKAPVPRRGRLPR